MPLRAFLHFDIVTDSALVHALVSDCYSDALVVTAFPYHLPLCSTIGVLLFPHLLFFLNTFFYISLSGWIKGSVSLDPSVEHDGYFIPEDQVTSEPEEEQDNKLVCTCPFFLYVWGRELLKRAS